ncbi:hypothetical protein BDZ91DRAFT_798905 [Kalaharituber pfeilii]|nr:hypothetical protein BDZ91DRAFT_798905 [Kalaharituber pfeilii]
MPPDIGLRRIANGALDQTVGETGINDLDFITVSHFEFFEQLRIKDKSNPSLPAFLMSRLVKANLTQRQYFMYAKSHHNKISAEDEIVEDPEKPTKDFKLSLQSCSASRALIDPSVAILSHTTATTYIDWKQGPFREVEKASYLEVIPEHRSEASQTTVTSVALTRAGDGNEATKIPKYIIPPPPQSYGVSGQPKPFRCPYCYKMVCVSRPREWKKHVLDDVRPYVCTFEHCAQEERLFDSRKGWYNHELQCHRREWECNVKSCESSVFSDLSSFHHHLRHRHSDVLSGAANLVDFNDDKLAFLSSHCEIQAGSEQKCLFCSVFLRPSIMTGHLATHLIDIALFTLPRSDSDTNDSNVVQEADDRQSSNHPTNQSIHQSLETMSNLSWGSDTKPADTHGLDEAEWWKRTLSSKRRSITAHRTAPWLDSTPRYTQPHVLRVIDFNDDLNMLTLSYIQSNLAIPDD